jgi:hypothetical protein
MLQSIALSSPLPTTNRFTPTATQKPVASPIAQTQRSGRKIDLGKGKILSYFNPVSLWIRLERQLTRLRLSSLKRKLAQMKQSGNTQELKVQALKSEIKGLKEYLKKTDVF